MSVVASVKVHDGIVLGAESMTQIWGSDPSGAAGIIKTYQHAQKLYQIADLPVGVMTYGIGNIGPRSIGSFISEFSSHVDQFTNVEKIGIDLSDFLKGVHQETFGKLPQEKQPKLGVFIGGYSPNNPLAEEWEFALPGQEVPKRVRPDDNFGASWRGVAVPFTRLYRGVDPRLREELGKKGIDEEAFRKLRDQFTSPIVFDAMPIQDAIDFVVFVLETTINMARFEVGMPSCGGPLWVATITKQDKFEWIQRPTWQVS
ncbi:MAG: hypothetical protein ACE5JL_13855 [Dehalococcoidia bacterium]